VTQLQKRESFTDAKNMFNPFFNQFGIEKEYKGAKMDYFGYMAHRMTGTIPVNRRVEEGERFQRQSQAESHPGRHRHPFHPQM
jgi:hypothetical protein